MKPCKANDGGAAELRYRTRRTRRNCGAGLAALMVCVLTTVQAQTASEYQVKAAYLYNFAKGTEWPEHNLPNATSPLLIGVVGGDEEFIDALKQTVAGKSAGTHPIIVKRVNSDGEMDFCQLVFFRASAGRKRTESAISSLVSASIVLVGEDDTFLRLGGMINLVLKNGTVRFEINKDSIDRAAIHLSPTLLTAATGQRGPASEPTSARTEAPGMASSGDSRRLKVSTPPEYPELARRMNIRGAVQLELTVGRDGAVKDIRIIGGHPMLTDALVKSVRGWRYEPAPKESLIVVKFVFAP